MAEGSLGDGSGPGPPSHIGLQGPRGGPWQRARGRAVAFIHCYWPTRPPLWPCWLLPWEEPAAPASQQRREESARVYPRPQPGSVPVGRPQRFGMRAALPLEARPLATAAAKARPRLERLSAEWLSG